MEKNTHYKRLKYRISPPSLVKWSSILFQKGPTGPSLANSWINPASSAPLAVDLHHSKPLISLVPFNLHFHCFSGIGALLCDNTYCFPS